MTGYQKKIAYLDYLENGMKIKNAGFVRLEKSNGQARLELRVRGIPEMFSGQYELKTNTEGVIGRISISRGCGSCCVVWKNGAGVPEGKRVEKAEGVYIRLPGRRLLQAVWDTPMDICVEEGEEREKERITEWMEDAAGELVMKEEGRRNQAAFPEKVAEMPAQGQERNIRQAEEENQTSLLAKEKTAAQERMTRQEQEDRAAPEWTGRQERENEAALKRTVLQPEKAEASGDGNAEKNGKPQEMACYGDKWEQLTHMYGVIHPFGDGREYLSIAPKDFVVLRQEYQKMVHNSFLLHGYYNYKHLILGRIREREEWRYYLGVPGNFYGREKMVAEMFGFEAFEGEKEPAKAGDFGYFMKRVEI